MTRRCWLLAALAVLAVAGCAELRARFPGPDVVYLPTPADVTAEMLRLAGVSARDVVFDLGSGDGRVVVAAARDFGARGFGVEIDPELVQQARDAAYVAGVTDRATFLWQDLFVTDLRGATVVTLYLRDDVNLRLRPKLLRELAAGSRVVSHDFDMGDWPADRVQRVRSAVRNHTLYLWLIPADAAGRWRLRLSPSEARLDLTQRYQHLAGTLAWDGRQESLQQARLAGDRITFTAGGQTFSGQVTGDTMTGTTAAGAAWTARRER
jgi:SAM-dependent methyltransferase